MMEAYFYHLEHRGFDAVLPDLVRRALARGWRAIIRADSAERAEAIDNLLWSYDEQSFLPHAQQGDGDARHQPVLITLEPGNANSAQVLFLVGDSNADWSVETIDPLIRIVILFDGREKAAVDRARQAREAAEDAGHEVTYWKESATGKFTRQS